MVKRKAIDKRSIKGNGSENIISQPSVWNEETPGGEKENDKLLLSWSVQSVLNFSSLIFCRFAVGFKQVLSQNVSASKEASTVERGPGKEVQVSINTSLLPKSRNTPVGDGERRLAFARASSKETIEKKKYPWHVPYQEVCELGISHSAV